MISLCLMKSFLVLLALIDDLFPTALCPLHPSSCHPVGTGSDFRPQPFIFVLDLPLALPF